MLHGTRRVEILVDRREPALDIIRVFATIVVLNFHYAALLGAEHSFFYKFANGDWGAGGVTIFFVLSGFLLKNSACSNKGIKNFYKSKFLRLFPMFYISFVIAYIIKSTMASDWLWGLEPWRFVFSAIGIDCYLGFYGVPSYAVVGEWFTFAIIIVYLLFPLLNYLMDRCLKEATVVVVVAIYLTDFIFDFSGINKNCTLTNAVMMSWIGMLIFKHKKYIMSKFTMLMALMIGLVLAFVRLPFADRTPCGQMEGICIFLFMYIALSRIKYKRQWNNAFCFFSNISYPIYINHHFLLYLLSNILLSVFGVWTFKLIIIFYMAWLAVTLLWSMGIYYLEKFLMSRLFLKHTTSCIH